MSESICVLMCILKNMKGEEIRHQKGMKGAASKVDNPQSLGRGVVVVETGLYRHLARGTEEQNAQPCNSTARRIPGHPTFKT